MGETKIEIIDNVTFYLHEVTNEEAQLLTEGKVKGEILIGTYSTLKHQPHNSTGDYHIHLLNKGNEVLAINKDGSGHDGYTGTRIPNKPFKALQTKYPSWNWPTDQIVETINYMFVGYSPRAGLRPVRVSAYKIYAKDYQGFKGYLHCFGNNVYIAGGGKGHIEELMAFVETESGNVLMVPPACITFIDL